MEIGRKGWREAHGKEIERGKDGWMDGWMEGGREGGAWKRVRVVLW